MRKEQHRAHLSFMVLLVPLAISKFLPEDNRNTDEPPGKKLSHVGASSHG